MVEITTGFTDFDKICNDLLAKGDPRVKDWFLMNPLHTLVYCALYLIIVGLLTLHTKGRAKGYNVKKIQIVHNIFLVSLSGYMLVELIRQAIIANYGIFGNGVDTSDAGLPMAKIIHIYYLSKVTEFVDTFLMALTKRYKQMTFLHIYHHSSIFIVWWIITYFVPGGDSYFSAALNSFIHVVMYSYFLWRSLSSRKPAPGTKPDWTYPHFYRKYITRLQLTQFLVMLFQSIYDSIVPGNYPKWPAYILFGYMLTMIALFLNFYLKSYKGKKAKKDHHKKTDGDKQATKETTEETTPVKAPLKKKKSIKMD